MIQIEDNDLPITVVEKIITGTKPYNPSPLMQKLSDAIVGGEGAGNTQDMFSLEEIKEIADYLIAYYNNHENGD